MDKRIFKSVILSGIMIGSIIALVAFVLNDAGSDNINMGFELISGSIASYLSGLSTLLTAGFAFGAGMVAAVNPCGFVMLPSYIAVYLLSESSSNKSIFSKLRRSLVVTLSMTLGFVVVFGLAGSIITFGFRSFVGSLLPWFGLFTGTILIIVASGLIFGVKQYTYISLPFKLSAMIPSFDNVSVKGYFVFGVSYALVSLGCALPIFMVVVGSTFVERSAIDVILSYINYSLGMGSVILVITIFITLVQRPMLISGKTLTRYVRLLTIGLLLLAGCYLLFYWLTIGEVL
ncbi:MAG TPA: hypothetical protein DEZ08_05700 [Dehalococcoidia bacterium]|jgi:cytochrome c-type biogenesis protein|nr:hypothetical protein [Dehalococcoidia bacterium]|tara:strand:- start:146 stop:1012 length:867 start_codon:yes stop_codon:yes gene_type:complete